MKRYLPFIIIALVAALTVTGSMKFYRAKMRIYNSGRPADSATGLKAEHVRGEADAPVTLEEFADFQCPACRVASGVLRAIEQEYGKRLRVIFRQFPLPMHRHGRDAALAAEAASLQGKFWEMHDLLYENQEAWSDAPDIRPIFDRYAESLHMNEAEFEKDCRSEEVAERVTAEHKLGESRGVENTPTMFINGQILRPPYTLEHLRETIGQALGEKEKE